MKHRKVSAQYSKYYYIPIFETLKALLNHEDVLQEVLNSHQSFDTVLRDMCDGKAFVDDPLFGCDSKALQLVAYYNDLEVCNPLGAAAKYHKVGAFFYFLANIRPQYRSSLNVSQLFAVAKSSGIKSHGVDAVLKPFVEDLKKLSQEGITVTIKSDEYTFKGNMVVFLADNLASHTIGGFKESMGVAFHFCRKCMTTKE